MSNYLLILITSVVKVSSSVSKLRNKEIRVNLLLAAIKNWLLIDKEIKIVICDGSV